MQALSEELLIDGLSPSYRYECGVPRERVLVSVSAA